MTEKRAIHVVLVPGADALEFGPDIAEAGLRGIAVHPLTLAKYTGHPIDGRRPYYDGVARQIADAIGDIRRAAPGGPIFAIGRNQGASILAYAAAGRDDFRGLVFTGAIPELSVYRAESDFPSAKSFRASLSGPAELARIAEMRDMDLTETLKRIPADRCLLQIGSQDDWMDRASFDVFRTLEKTHRVEWIDDGHAMISPAALAGRWAFIERMAQTVENGREA
jgi:pimeloyl-ACP methyl ester carboxylesterase